MSVHNMQHNMQQNSQYPDDSSAAPGGAQDAWVPVKFVGVKPGVVYTIIAVTVVVYILQEASRFLAQGVDFPLLFGVKINEAILEGQLWRLFTPMLLHGSLIHIGVNMYSLYSLGPALETHYGHWRFLALYLLGGFAGNVFSFMFNASPSLGASTAIFGLVGAYGVFLYHNRQLLGEAAGRGLRSIITVALINLLIGMSGGIDNWGHLGGLAGGLAFAWFGGPVMMITGGLPVYQLVDRRSDADVLRAGLTVGACFVLLAAATIVLRLG